MYDHLHEIAARTEHQEHLRQLERVQVPVRHSRLSLLRSSIAEALRRRRAANAAATATAESLHAGHAKPYRPYVTGGTRGWARRSVFLTGASDHLVSEQIRSSEASGVRAASQRVQPANDQW